MHPDHPTRVLAGCTGFRAETGGVSGEAERESGLVEDFSADVVGQGDFGGGNEPTALFTYIRVSLIEVEPLSLGQSDSPSPSRVFFAVRNLHRAKKFIKVFASGCCEQIFSKL